MQRLGVGQEDVRRREECTCGRRAPLGELRRICAGCAAYAAAPCASRIAERARHQVLRDLLRVRECSPSSLAKPSTPPTWRCANRGCSWARRRPEAVVVEQRAQQPRLGARELVAQLPRAVDRPRRVVPQLVGVKRSGRKSRCCSTPRRPTGSRPYVHAPAAARHDATVTVVGSESRRGSGGGRGHGSCGALRLFTELPSIHTGALITDSPTQKNTRRAMSSSPTSVIRQTRPPTRPSSARSPRAATRARSRCAPRVRSRPAATRCRRSRRSGTRCTPSSSSSTPRRRPAGWTSPESSS